MVIGCWNVSHQQKVDHELVTLTHTRSQKTNYCILCYFLTDFIEFHTSDLAGWHGNWSGEEKKDQAYFKMTLVAMNYWTFSSGKRTHIFISSSCLRRLQKFACKKAKSLNWLIRNTNILIVITAKGSLLACCVGPLCMHISIQL